MINKQIETLENPYEIIQKPRLSTMPVYIDGERAKTHDVARFASYGAKMIGYAAWKTFTLGCMVLDHAIESSAK